MVAVVTPINKKKSLKFNVKDMLSTALEQLREIFISRFIKNKQIKVGKNKHFILNA